MYKTLRSDGKLSYALVEGMFESHQNKWPEAIFNEDAWFKYIDPLVEDGTGSYLAMAQGSKTEQRRWWLYNRFRYIDSKYNAGDALTDVVQLRGYAKANVTVTPYADIYPAVKYGSYLVTERGHRNTATTLVCPLDTVNDTEIYIYSASQLGSIGDLSGLKVGFADFSMATRISSIKVGDNTTGYTNGNLTELYVGNNALLNSVDARNCTALTGSVDLGGAKNVETVLFDGTAITGCVLPVGGILKTLKLPSTITNLTIRDQTSLTTFDIGGYTNITTLRIENTPEIPFETIINTATNLDRVRLVNIDWESSGESALQSAITKLRSCSGLDANGNNIPNAVLSGRINVESISDSLLTEINTYFPEVVIVIDGVAQYLVRFMNTNNTLVYSMLVGEGENAVDPVATGLCDPPTLDPSGGIYYVYNRWEYIPTNVHANTEVYAVYDERLRVRYLDWDDTVLQLDYVTTGATVVYHGDTPSREQTAQYTYTFTGWSATTTNVQTSVDAIAQYSSTLRSYTVRFYNGTTLLQTKYNIDYGGTATYTGGTPTHTNPDFVFTGFQPDGTNITGPTDCYAVFVDTAVPLVKYLKRDMTAYESNTATTIAAYAFYQFTTLETVETSATSIGNNTFDGCTNLNTVDLTSTSADTIEAGAFNSCNKLAHLIIRSTTISTLSNTNALSGTKIASGNGAIYVPTSLVTSYKAASNWSNYASQIYAISEYPKTDFSTISDSWEQIINNTTSYATDYAINDTKLFDIGSKGTMYAELIALDTDDLADNSGKARMTFLCKAILENKAMNSTQKTVDGTTSYTAGGWAYTDVVSYLENDILPLMPEVLRNNIKSVTKTYRCKSPTDETKSMSNKLWILSYKEVGFTNSSYVESSGVTYSSKFTNNSSRIKYNSNGSANRWWLRSAYDTYNFSYVSSNGNESNSGAINSYGIVFGFCI